MSTLAEARAQFIGGRHYFGACSVGLASSGTLAAMREDQQNWADGRCSPAMYDAAIVRTRASFARLMNVAPDRVAIGSQTSAMVSVLAAAVPDGAEVLCVDGDFSSMVYPFVVAGGRGVVVRHVKLAALAAAITPETYLVAFSLVQSASGEVADVAAITRAAAANGAYTLCDTTQAAGAMPVDASLFDATVCHAYKWLCAPRGAAFMTLAPAYERTLAPIQANWYAGEEIWGSCYGPVMQLSADARRFDVSPAWPVWVGTEPVIALFASLDLDEVHAHNVALGNALCDGLGLERKNQAIVTWPDADGRQLAALTAAGLVASGRAGCARVAFHLWNDEQDVADVLAALALVRDPQLTA
ncbi:aminotransferase class V-fold PLP-dependent enzyme [Agreia sp. COWG]|uniref:aminotransferase class V-fold PLP-dependent enzyme n=1 Tax=Agreia sp. COWG TaxID=2773266 RepID=UPI0019277D81|nr:aminotransferase class V-fold PLP-dependent enzyme [Agreia sp. COWG]CAD5989385.1 Cysteine desulfurase [Agreia sp. COWG]